MSPADISLNISLTGYDRMLRMLETMGDERTYRGAFRDTIVGMLKLARDYAESITHHLTGGIKENHVMEYDAPRMKGNVHINPNAYRRPYNGYLPHRYQRVAEYAVFEHARGGSHAFYARTLQETGGVLQFTGSRAIVDSIERQLP